MKKNIAQKDILYISISSCVLVVLWVGFNIYHAHVTSTIEPSLQLQIAPIEPRFDSQVIQNLKNRQKVAPIFELNSATNEADIPPTPVVTTAPVITDISPTPATVEITPPDEVEPLIPLTEPTGQ